MSPVLRKTAAELGRVDDRALHPRKLAAIYRKLPEHDRWPFMLALSDQSFERVYELTSKEAQPCHSISE